MNEKWKWLWDNFPAWFVCLFSILVGIWGVLDAVWRAFHGEWLQCGKDLSVAVVCLVGTVLIWKFYQWSNRMFKRWIDKSPKT